MMFLCDMSSTINEANILMCTCRGRRAFMRRRINMISSGDERAILIEINVQRVESADILQIRKSVNNRGGPGAPYHRAEFSQRKTFASLRTESLLNPYVCTPSILDIYTFDFCCIRSCYGYFIAWARCENTRARIRHRNGVGE